jgi:endo-1,4-beta-xylanase
MEKLKTEFPTLNVYAWDVVNEAFQENGTIRKGGFNASSGESAWTLVYGDDSYIDQAFTYAKKYAPANSRLFYNDYNEYTPAKRDAIYNMANRLKSKNLIDGIGMQSHLSVSWSDMTLYKQALQKYSSLGLEMQVTELDLTQSDQSDAGIKAQTDKYTSIMQALVDAKKSGANITSVVFWGITDGTSWRKEGHPLLFDANYNAKPVLYSIENLIPKSEYETPYTLGDLNNDGAINTIDLSLMKRGLLNGFTDSNVKLASDMNNDGNVNSVDLALLKRQILNK